MLRLPTGTHAEIVADLLRALPLEGCGLIASAPGSDTVTAWYPIENAARSSRLYTVDPGGHLRADRAAEDHGWEICGVVHSHTHTDPYPSPTDVAQAPDPSWHYVLVSFRFAEPSTRSYRIVDGEIAEEPLELV